MPAGPGNAFVVFCGQVLKIGGVVLLVSSIGGTYLLRNNYKVLGSLSLFVAGSLFLVYAVCQFICLSNVSSSLPP
jgi:hypothetical protein